MSFADGMRMGGDWYDSAKQNQRLDAKAAWEAEQQAQTRDQWGREAKSRADMDKLFNQQNPDQTSVDPATSFGITRDSVAPPRPSEPSAGSYYGSDSVGGLQGAGLAPQGAVATTNGAAPQSYAQQQRAMLQQQMDFAKAARDPNAYQTAHKEMFKLKVGEDSAKIADFVQNASDGEYKQLLSKVTADTQNKYEAVYDKKTGLTSLKLGDAKKDFTRAEMGEYFAAKNRLKNGDFTANADLERLDKGLAAAVQAELKGMEGMANTNNKGAEIERKIANDNARLGVEQQKLGLMRSSATNKGPREVDPKLTAESNRLYQAYQDADPKERAVLERQWNMVQGQIATSLGKTMQLNAGPRGGMAPMSKIEEAGTGYRDNESGRIKYADGRGGFIAEGGVQPTERGTILKKAGIPDNLVGDLPWNADGTAVGFGGQAYNVKDPADMRALARDYARLSSNEIAATEARNPAYPKTRKTGMGGEIYYKDGVDMPTQAQWDAYNAKQQR